MPTLEHEGHRKRLRNHGNISKNVWRKREKNCGGVLIIMCGSRGSHPPPATLVPLSFRLSKYRPIFRHLAVCAATRLIPSDSLSIWGYFASISFSSRSISRLWRATATTSIGSSFSRSRVSSLRETFFRRRLEAAISRVPLSVRSLILLFTRDFTCSRVNMRWADCLVTPILFAAAATVVISGSAIASTSFACRIVGPLSRGNWFPYGGSAWRFWSGPRQKA